jgi:hypothetical protein
MAREDEGWPAPGNMPAWNDQPPQPGPYGPGPYGPGPYGAGPYGANPYGPPGSGQPAPGGWPPPPLNLASLSGLATALYVLFPLVLLASLAQLAALGNRYNLLQEIRDDPTSVTVAEADRADAGVAFGVIAYLLLVIATGIVFIVWFHRARGNADLLGGHYQRRSRGWAIGGWFCPVVNLWFPFQIATDVLLEADRAGSQPIPGRQGYGLLRAWWTLFTIGNLLALGANGQGDDIDGLLRTDSFDITSTLLDIPAAVLAILVVRRITTAYVRLQAGPMPNWPPAG